MRRRRYRRRIWLLRFMKNLINIQVKGIEYEEGYYLRNI